MIPDATLVALAQRGDRAASAELVDRYTDAAYGIATRFFMPGGDRDDVRQEALFGILRAIRYYRPGHVPFGGFAAMCVRRWLIFKCVREPQRMKALPLNESLRTDRDEDDPLTPVTLLEDHRADVPQLAEDRAELHRIVDALGLLTPLEAHCVVALALGFSYDEIDAQIGPTFKGTDNAIQRGRRKLRAAA